MGFVARVKYLGLVIVLALVSTGCEFTKQSGIVLKSASQADTISAPQSIFYSVNPATYKVANLIPLNAPTVVGGVPSEYSITPVLPSGFLFNTQTGVISGTPTAVSLTTDYTVTAKNSEGSAATSISISVATNIISPSNLTYSSLAPVLIKGTPITALTPSSQGGAPTNYSVSPTLPAGLVLNAVSGVISGTPTALSAASSFTITAANSVGSATVILSITVTELPPATVTYSVNPASYKVATLITPNIPTTTGGTASSYSVTPSLPAGLVLNLTTGVITGTPTVVSAASGYTVKAQNSAGSAQVVLTISVPMTIVAPTNLTYSNMTPVLIKGSAITALSPTSQGGAPTSYSVTPNLPAGLTLNTTTGVITGTPTTLSAATAYTVTATNSAGSATTTLTLSVIELAPATLSYSLNPASYKVATAVSANSPTTTGGIATSYSITPALPTGLTFNLTSGVLSGTPTAVSTATVYTVKATNSAGSVTTTLTITVLTNVVAPATLTYSSASFIYVKGTTVTALSPTTMGGTPTSYAAASLPAGLTINVLTGVISGTPTAVQVMTPVLITATNAGGSATATLNFTVNDLAPTALTYGVPKTVYTKGTAITSNTPTSAGGAIISYSVSPALPAGLLLNSTTGVISGTPTTALLPAVVTVTGINSGGSITTALTFGVADFADTNANYDFIQTNLMVPRCAGCHTTGFFPGASDYTTYTNLKVTVVAGSPLTSPLFIRTAAGALSPMPPGSTITSVQSLAIMNWIARGAPNGTVTPSPTPSPSPTVIAGTTLLVASDERMRIGNRLYIASTLQDIFGASAMAPVTTLISAPANYEVLGGPCNGYSDIGVINYGTLSIGSDCASNASAQVQAIPMVNSARGALITRACNLILNADAAVLNAATLALGNSVTTATIPAMNAASIQKTYDLFYQGRPMSTAISADLLAVANFGTTALESWRFTLLTLCYAPDWQIP